MLRWKAFSQPVLVSACLLGLPTRYDGRSCPLPGLETLAALGWLVPICPEVAGGLAIPRPPAECVGGDGRAVLAGEATVRTIRGADVTAAFLRGARQALEVARRLGIRAALLKERSPSCGRHWIYDGTFQHRLIQGQGVTTALLLAHGLTVWSDEEWVRQQGPAGSAWPPLYLPPRTSR